MHTATSETAEEVARALELQLNLGRDREETARVHPDRSAVQHILQSTKNSDYHHDLMVKILKCTY